MSVDAEGYGFPEHQRTLSRLIDDIRVLSPAGVERAAQGWDRHGRLHGLQAIHEAEKAAVHAIEKEGRGAAWDEVRRNLFGMTEAGGALVSLGALTSGAVSGAGVGGSAGMAATRGKRRRVGTAHREPSRWAVPTLPVNQTHDGGSGGGPHPWGRCRINLQVGWARAPSSRYPCSPALRDRPCAGFQ